MIYLELIWGFLKVGLFSFGGAYAAIPLIREVVLDYGWIGEETLADMIAVSESTPGPIMVNLATYIGSTRGGLAGAFLATAAVILPAFLIVILILAVLKKAADKPIVQAMMHTVAACVAGIILATGLFMILQNCLGVPGNLAPDPTALAVTAGLAGVYFGSRLIKKRGISPILLIGIAALAGVLVYSPA